MSIEPKPEQKQHSAPEKRSILKRSLGLLIQSIMLVAVVVIVDAWMTRNTAHGIPPAMEGRTISGENFSIDDFKGEVALLHFWGTWCPVCNLEHGTIDALNKDFQMMTVALQSGRDHEIDQYLLDKGVHYSVLNDNRGEISPLCSIAEV